MIACPDCENTRAVRAMALDDHLWTHLVTLALPVLIIAAISLLLYRVTDRLPQRATRKDTADER
jgi:hypothetical protein